MKNLGDWLAKDVITVAMVTEGDTTLEDLGIMEIEPGQTIIKCKDVEALPVGMVDPQRFAAAMKLAGGLAGHARNLGDEKRALKAENAKLRELVRDYLPHVSCPSRACAADRLHYRRKGKAGAEHVDIGQEIPRAGNRGGAMKPSPEAMEAEIERLRELVWVMHDWMARALHDKSCRRWEYDEIVCRMAEMGFEVGA